MNDHVVGLSETGRRHPRVLVISYHFPPDGAVGGLRWAGLAKYLARLGFEVHVVTAAEGVRVETVDGVHVHAVPRARTLNDIYRRWVLRRRPIPPFGVGNSGGNNQARVSRGLLAALRHELGAALTFPDVGRGWILRAARRSRSLLRTMEFDAVVSSGPPHSAHLAAILATVGRPVSLLVDMRDPWSGMLAKRWGRELYSSIATPIIIPYLERLVVRRARRLIANTMEFAAELRGAHPNVVVSFVRNGIDQERLPPLVHPHVGSLSLAYVGTLYAGRDISPVLRALPRFFARRPEARARTSLRIAGPFDGDHERRFDHLVEELGVRDVVEILGSVPSSRALEVLNQSHLLLVLAQDQQMQIPAKLYECMGFHRPTLVIAEATSAAFREAERIGAIACEADDIDGIARLLDTLWSGKVPPRPVPAVPIDYAGLAVEVASILEGCRQDRGLPPGPETATGTLDEAASRNEVLGSFPNAPRDR